MAARDRTALSLRAAGWGILVLSMLLGPVLLRGPAEAQEAGREGAGPTSQPMVTDRPDFTESAMAVRRPQVESGYTLTRDSGVERHTLGEVLVRLPAAPGVELRVGASSYEWSDVPGDEDGFSDASVGTKLEVSRSEGPGWRPAVALLAGTSLPVGDVSDAGLQPEAILALGWDLSPRVGLGANLGVGYLDEPQGRFAELSGSVALGVDVGGGVGLYLETYGFEPTGEGGPSTSFVDGGVTWSLGPDLQLDARIGAGIGGPSEDLLAGVGLAVRP